MFVVVLKSLVWLDLGSNPQGPDLNSQGLDSPIFQHGSWLLYSWNNGVVGWFTLILYLLLLTNTTFVIIYLTWTTFFDIPGITSCSKSSPCQIVRGRQKRIIDSSIGAVMAPVSVCGVMKVQTPCWHLATNIYIRSLLSHLTVLQSISPLCITYSVIKGQFHSCHDYMERGG